jgi:hypothetical protein
MHRPLCLLAALALPSAGCLASSFSIAPAELSRLARIAPADRWRAVRATQGMGGSDELPRASAAAPASAEAITPSPYFFNGSQVNVPATWGTREGSGASRPVRFTGGGTSGGGTSGGGTSGGGTSGGGTSGGGTSGGGTSGGGAAVLGAAAIVVVGAAVMVFVLAGTEGVRYDGWFALPPHEPVYVTSPDGMVTAFPLSTLTPEVADRALGAWVDEGPTERYLRLARAPLNRAGFTLSAGPVVAAIPQPGAGSGDTGLGFGGRCLLGFFPRHELGFGLAVEVLATSIGPVYAGAGLEAQAMPFTHVGAYLAGGGYAVVDDAAPAGSYPAWYGRAGLQFELPFTTRFTGQLRVGALRIAPEGRSPIYAPEAALSVAVY